MLRKLHGHLLLLFIVRNKTSLHECSLLIAQYDARITGVDGGDDLDDDMLRDVYRRIKQDELKTGDDHVTQVLNVSSGACIKTRTRLTAFLARAVVYFRICSTVY